MEFRDAAKGRDVGETQEVANRQLELKIKDLAAYLKGQVVGISTLADLRSFRQSDRPQKQDQHRQFKPNDRGMER
jgi:hypothetical protein